MVKIRRWDGTSWELKIENKSEDYEKGWGWLRDGMDRP